MQGWPNHPHGQGGGPATPKGHKRKGFWLMGGGQATPWPRNGPATPKRQQKKKNVFWLNRPYGCG